MTFQSLIEQTLNEIEKELKLRGEWKDAKPMTEVNAAASFQEWLQHVYLPSTQTDLAHGRRPHHSRVGAIGARHYKKDNTLVNLCVQLARLDYYVNRHVDTLLEGPLKPAGDATDGAREEAVRELIAMAENVPNAVYNVAVHLVVGVGQRLYAGERDETILRVLHDAEMLCRWVNDFGMEVDAQGTRALHASATIQLGQVLYFQKRYDEAEEALLRGMNINPHNGTWLTCADTLARIYMERQEFDKAQPLLQKLVEHHPAYAPGHQKLRVCTEFREKVEAEARKKRELEVVNRVGHRVQELTVELQQRIKTIMTGEIEPVKKVAEIKKVQAEFQEHMSAAMADSFKMAA